MALDCSGYARGLLHRRRPLWQVRHSVRRAFGEQLGLPKDWAARAVKAVGNYGEIYERNVGSQSKLAIPRGLNALWTNGGVQYAPPIR